MRARQQRRSARCLLIGCHTHAPCVKGLPIWPPGSLRYWLPRQQGPTSVFFMYKRMLMPIRCISFPFSRLHSSLSLLPHSLSSPSFAIHHNVWPHQSHPVQHDYHGQWHLSSWLVCFMGTCSNAQHPTPRTSDRICTFHILRL